MSLRLGTLNLLHGRSLRDGLVDLDRVQAAVAGLDVDVLAIQEVDRDQPRSGHADLTAVVAEALGAAEHRFVPTVWGTPGEQWRPVAAGDDPLAPGPAYGIGLVSRLPVTSWTTVPLRAAPVRSPITLPGSGQWIWLRDEPRAGLTATVALPGGGSLAVTGTHLSFVPGWNVLQLRRLLGRLDDGPHVLIGDLNLPAPLPRLTAPGWRPLATARTWPAPDPKVQFDHVLGRGVGPARSVLVEELAFSDHRALVVELD